VGRHRSARHGRWRRAAAFAAAYLAAVSALSVLDVGDAGAAPPWAVVAVPPFFYAALSRVLLRRAPPARRLAWLGGACLVHLLLGAAAAASFAALAHLTPLSALAQVFARLGLVPLLTLLATPLVLAPFRGRVLPPRPAPRSERVVRPPVLLMPPQAPAGETPFARAARRRDGAAEPVAPPAAPAEPAAAVPPAPPDDGVVRVRFERVAAQLPAGAFTLPLDRVAESLREPHWLTIPRRVVIAQLPEGAVQVDWALVASQFPPLAFAVSDVEFRRKYPDLRITLPLDDLLRQLPRGVLATGGAPSRIAGLDAFPPPFQPLVRPQNVSPAAPAAGPPDAPDVPPDIVAVVSAPVAAAPAPPPVTVAPPPPEILGRLAACLTGAGTFEAWSGIVDEVPLVAFVAPSLSRAAVTAVAARLAGLLGAAAGEQVTVRTARAAIVVAAAPTPVVVAARRPGAPVALLELRAARAAALAGRAGEGRAPAARELAALTVEPRVAGVAGMLGAFGGVEPAVLTDPAAGARVYVFRERGRDAARVGALALAAWEGMARVRDADLGALVSIVFRQGRRRTLVRPLAGGAAAALLAADGTVARPGRAWREADRAAAVLEAR
jgi:hypothetical protein